MKHPYHLLFFWRSARRIHSALGRLWMSLAFGRLYISLAFGRLYMSSSLLLAVRQKEHQRQILPTSPASQPQHPSTFALRIGHSTESTATVGCGHLVARATLYVSRLRATLAIAAATSLRVSTCAVFWPLWMNSAFGWPYMSLAFGRLYMSLAFGRLWMRSWHCHSRLALFQLLLYRPDLLYIYLQVRFNLCQP